jgi:solute carrier family 20 (sodium-dependent phosphate transporter)
MGFGLANINFFRGFCIELASAISVVLATVLKMPVSTTHCQVGAVIFVSWSAFGASCVKWKMFGWIALTWVVTLPLSAGLAALLLVVSRSTIQT